MDKELFKSETPWSIQTKDTDTDKYNYDLKKAHEDVPLDIRKEGIQTKNDVANLSAILQDILAGNDAAHNEVMFKSLNFNAIRKFLAFLQNKGDLTDEMKSDLLLNAWKINFKRRPPTMAEFLTRKYIGMQALTLNNYVKNGLLKFYDPLSPYRTLILHSCIGAGKSTLTMISNLYEAVCYSLMWNPFKYFGGAPSSVYVLALASWSDKKAGELYGEPLRNIIEQAPYFVRLRTHNEMKELNDQLLAGQQTAYGNDCLPYTTAAGPGSICQFAGNLSMKAMSTVGGQMGLNIMHASFSELSFFIDEGGWTNEKIWTFFQKVRSRVDSRMKGNYYGRSQPLDSKVLMANGLYKNIGDIKIGDRIRTPREGVQTVITKTKKTIKKCYELMLIDGRTVRCSPDHLWDVTYTKDNQLIRQVVTTDFILKNFSNIIFYISYCEQIASIKQLDDCEQVCIGISGTEHLYITDNEVPTHNCVLDSSPNTMESVIDKYIVDDAPKDPQNLVISGSRWKWFPEEFPKFVVDGKEQHNFDVGFPLYKGTNGEPPRVIESETDLSTFANQDVIWCPKEQSTDLGSVSYIGKAKSEPIEFLRDLAGIPAGSANRIFYDPHVVDDIFDNDLPAVYAPIQAKSTDNPEKLIWNQVKSDLFNWQIDHYQLKYKPQLLRVASVDLAISGDAASICLAHSELKDNNGELLPCYVADALIEVVPVGGQINLDAFSCFIEDLISDGNMKIKYVSYDQFQSRPFEQRLKRLGIIAEYVSVDKNNEPYSNLIDYAWNRRIFAGKNVMLKNNLFSLHLTKRKSGTMKYDHFNGENTYQDDWCLPKSKYTKESWQNSQVGAYAKDAADSLAASVYLLMTHQSDMQGSSIWNPYHLSQQDAMKNLDDILKTTGFSL